MAQSRQSPPPQERHQERGTVSPPLSSSPFQHTTDFRFVYVNAANDRAYAELLAGIRDRKGLAVLTGEAGTGKTTLLHLLFSTFDENALAIVIHRPPQTFADFVALLCNHLSLPRKSNETESQLDLLEEYWRSCVFHEDAVVLLIDDAQLLDLATLRYLATLLNRKSPRGKLIQIVLAGHPQLEKTLLLPQARPLAKHVATQLTLPRLTEEEVAAFIQHRLHVAAWPQEQLFSSAAIERIAQHSEGLPRRINSICDSALRAAYAAGQKTISASLIEDVVPALAWHEEPQHPAISFHPPSRPIIRPPSTPATRQSWRDLYHLRRRFLRASRQLFIVGLVAFSLFAGVFVWNRSPAALLGQLWQRMQTVMVPLLTRDSFHTPHDGFSETQKTVP